MEDSNSQVPEPPEPAHRQEAALSRHSRSRRWLIWGLLPLGLLAVTVLGTMYDSLVHRNIISYDQLLPTAQVSSTEPNEYVVPNRFSFEYPPHFEPATDFMTVWNYSGGQTIVLTEASEVEQAQWMTSAIDRANQENISLANSLAETDFFPNQSILISPIPGSFTSLKESYYKAADPQFQQTYEERYREQFPISVIDLRSISTSEGIEGIIYVKQDNYPLPGKTAISVGADFPYSVAATSSGVMDFQFPVLGSSSIEDAESTLGGIVASVRSE